MNMPIASILRIDGCNARDRQKVSALDDKQSRDLRLQALQLSNYERLQNKQDISGFEIIPRINFRRTPL